MITQRQAEHNWTAGHRVIFTYSHEQTPSEWGWWDHGVYCMGSEVQRQSWCASLMNTFLFFRKITCYTFLTCICSFISSWIFLLSQTLFCVIDALLQCYCWWNGSTLLETLINAEKLEETASLALSKVCYRDSLV